VRAALSASLKISISLLDDPRAVSPSIFYLRREAALLDVYRATGIYFFFPFLPFTKRVLRMVVDPSSDGAFQFSITVEKLMRIKKIFVRSQ